MRWLRSDSQSAFGAFVLRLLEALRGWRRDTVLDVLSSPWIDLPGAGPEDVSAFPLLARTAQIIGGYDEWLSRLGVMVGLVRWTCGGSASSRLPLSHAGGGMGLALSHAGGGMAEMIVTSSRVFILLSLLFGMPRPHSSTGWTRTSTSRTPGRPSPRPNCSPR